MNYETPTQPLQPAGGPPRKLQRSGSDRVLAGVAGGLGSYFGVDPLLFRVGLALSVFFGGFGLIAYLLLAIFVPTDGEADSAQKLGGRLRKLGIWRALGIAAGVLAVAALLLGLAGGGAFAVAVGWGVPVAVVIITAAALLLFAAFRGGSRWLIAPVLALAIGASAAAASNLDFKGGIGEQTYQPLSAGAIPEGGYELGVGRLVVDLRRLDWSRERVVHVNLRLGIGQAMVFVPSDVCVTTLSHLGIGESEVAGQRSSGVDLNPSVGAGPAAVPRVVLGAHLDVGQLQVVNSDSASADSLDEGPGSSDQASETLRAAEARACAPR